MYLRVSGGSRARTRKVRYVHRKCRGLQFHNQSQKLVPRNHCFMIYVFLVLAWLSCRNRRDGWRVSCA
ncbi:hypothetical protein M434DRAFT_145118 [Hypoxylon sp. CO27-5]|nr:hypothetical protein M434DRAFT_145118 [Hypoxylon sp. CO27-5]